MTEPLRLTRALVDRLPPRTDERRRSEWRNPTRTFTPGTAAHILSQLDHSGQLWVFAAGSLIWNPRFEVT